MWFSRRRRDEPDAGPEPAAASVRGPAAPASPDGPARRDWAAVATIQPISTSIDRAIDTHFERDLSSWRSPAVLRPLDHAILSDAPSGLVLDSIARSALPRVEAPADAPPARTVTFDPPPP